MIYVGGFNMGALGADIGSNVGIELYLPDAPDLPKTPKQYIVNVCTAVIGPAFKNWVREQVEDVALEARQGPGPRAPRRPE